MPRSLLAAGLLLVGCASAPPTPLAAGHPAAPSVASATTASVTPLAPAERPTPPPALRRSAPVERSAPMDHGSMDHGDHGTMAAPDARPAPEADAPLADALDAYLALHDALADDRLEGVSALATAFADAFAEATATAPADDPHLWHMRSAETASVRDAALALAEADDLDAARAAFGALSLPFADLVAATGTPADVQRYTCGMRTDLPGDGVWLQRGDAPRNPYFGSAMLMCARQDAPGSASEGSAHDHDVR